MPTVNMSIPHYSDTVSRVACQNAVEHLQRRLQLPRVTKAVYEEGTPVASTEALMASGRVGGLKHHNALVASYQETYTEDGILTSTVYRKDHPPFFEDKALGIALRPYYAEVKMRIQLKYNFRDKTQLERLQQALRAIGGMSDYNDRLALTYDYNVPNDMLVFLNDVHDLKEATAGYGETLSGYLKRGFIKGLAVRADQAGGNKTPVILEEQHGIVGRFEDEIFYGEPEKDDGEYRLAFTYYFTYQRPHGVVMTYPNVVHNRRIPAVYRSAWQPKELLRPVDILEPHSFIPAPSRKLIDRFYDGDGGIRLDPTDPFAPRVLMPLTRSLLVTPLQVDPNDLHQLVAIEELRGVLPAHVPDYLLAYPDQVTEPYAVPYLIEAFSVAEDELSVTLEVDTQGNIRSKGELDLRRRYYLRISAVTDLSKMSTDHFFEMVTHGSRTIATLELADSRVNSGRHSMDIAPLADGRVAAAELRAIIKKLMGTNRHYARQPEITPRHILNVNLVSWRA